MKKVPGTFLVEEKYRRLQEIFRGYGRVLVAFSGGVDSTLVLKVAIEALGPANVLAVTAVSPSMAQADREDAVRLARLVGAPHRLIETREVEQSAYRANTGDRCYHCKSELYDRLAPMAQSGGWPVIVDGTNVDDLGDFRPGQRAKQEHGVVSPLVEAGLTKAEVRELSRHLGLPTWDKPANACLASRIAYFEEVTPEKLRMVESAEQVLRDLGCSNARVRVHQAIARIELPLEELPLVVEPAARQRLVERLKTLGFTYITLDLEGLRTGSLNVLLHQPGMVHLK